MSAEDKARYKSSGSGRFLAKQPPKQDCHGGSLSQAQRERDELEQTERTMKRAIESTVKKSVRDGAFTTQKYHFVMANYFLKTSAGVHVPAELSACKFSLKEGVHLNEYHALIASGEYMQDTNMKRKKNKNGVFIDVDIFGYQYDAHAHSNATHMLPLPPKALGDADWGNTFNGFIEYIRDPITKEIPPVYTHEDHLTAVKSVINVLQTDVEVMQPVEVYPIQYLFFIMKQHACVIGEKDKPASIFVTNAQFNADCFEYEANIACNFHEEKDRTKYCSLSYVRRWGYMFGDYMCDDVGIPPKRGYHIPARAKLNAITIEPDEEAYHPAVKKEEGADDAWENRWNNETQDLPERTFSQDFPALGSKRNKSAAISVSSYAPSVAIKNENMQINDTYDEYDLEASNPWSRSQRKKPQEPDSSSFSVSYSLGTVQTLLPDDDSVISNNNWPVAGAMRKKPSAGSGRGKIFH